MHLSQKRKIFCEVFLDFLNSASTLNIFEKKMTFIADIFFNVQTPKNVVR